ncbi:MAG TPA: ATP-grasp domain-containing protein [Candidatus Limnocylindria bacterium]|nr:ATP-grasp domain-containing protein [Candidatus Limnocylindria bacterium]
MSAGRPKICVLGKEDRAFLAVVRSFGRRGAEVHLCWTPPDALARQSRYVARVHDEVPLYSAHDDAWKPAFIHMLERERFDLVVPTNDASIIPLQTHRAELEPHGRIYLIPDRAFDICFDKEKSYALAAACNVPLPPQHVLRLPAPPDAIDLSWYPLVLKPHASFTLDDLKQKHFVRKVREPSQLPDALAHFEGASEVLVQRHFHGTGAGIEMLAVDGKILTALQHLRIHERRKGGADSYRVTLPIRQDMYDAAARMVRALDYTGVIMFELKLDLETREWVLIEINARFWASLPLCLHAGADFPWWLYEALVLGRREFPQDYRVGVYCRNWGRDLVWLKENFEAPPDERVPLTTLARELGPLLRGREASDTFALDDPAPGLEDLRRLGARALGRVRRLTRRVADRIPGVQARRAARARRALAEARDVLFVCKGNICRSPFAEAYLRSRLNGRAVHVHSAGYHPKRNRPCPAEAVAAAHELATDLAPHRSRILDAAMVQAADAIFTFDQENFTTVLARHPDARHKVHQLSALAGGDAAEIRDPFGGTIDDFRRTYDRIRRALDAGLAAR